MTITLEINNPFFRDTLEEMAGVAKMTPEALCSAIITKNIIDYSEEVSRAKYDAVYWQLPQSARDDLDARKKAEEEGKK